MGYKALLFLEKILMALPESVRRGFFSFLALMGYYTLPKYRKIVHTNLTFLFGKSMDDTQKDAITRYSFKNLMFNIMYLMELRHMSKEAFKKKVSVKNFETVQKALNEKKPIIYITSHYSAWELAGSTLSVYAEPVTAVYKHLKNRQYEEWLLSSREHFGNRSVEKSNVLKKLIKVVKKKEAIGILIDTNINKKDGIPVKFFNKTIHQTPVPAYLSRKFDAVIIPAVIRTDDDIHYELTFYDPIQTPKTEDESADIAASTQMQATWLEEVIRKEPKFWFWLHRRFKNDYPEIYKEI